MAKVRYVIRPKALAKAGGKKQGKPPKEYAEAGATKPEHYADPNNYKYPIYAKDPEVRKKFIRAALAYFMKTKNREKYEPDARKTVLRRIIRAAEKEGIGVSDHVYESAGLKVPG